MEETTHRSALLVAPILDHRPSDSVADLGDGVRQWRGKLSEHIDSGSMQGWVEQFGKWRWGDMLKEAQLVSLSRPCDGPDDAQDDRLAAELCLVLSALALVEVGATLHGAAWVLTGPAETREPLGFLAVHGITRPKEMVRPHYASKAWIRDCNQQGAAAGDWLRQWVDNVTLLRAFPGSELPRILYVGLGAFSEARSSHLLEFRIPNLVRAAEAVLALPAGKLGGRNGFAKRAQLLAPDLDKDPVIGEGMLEERLKKLYGLRNDCFHGKVPFEIMKGSDEGSDEAARLEYLAEKLAKRALVHGLRRGHEPFFADRDRLEKAWEKNTLP